MDVLIFIISFFLSLVLEPKQWFMARLYQLIPLLYKNSFIPNTITFIFNQFFSSCEESFYPYILEFVQLPEQN